MKTIILLFLSFVALSSQEYKLPTSFSLTPDANNNSSSVSLNPHLKNYPDYVAGQAVSISISPDKNSMLILTSGYNILYSKNGKIDKSASSEYVFVFDLNNKQVLQKQVIKVPNTFFGILWHPKEDSFYISGGKDDCIYKYVNTASGYELSNTIKLNHKRGIVEKLSPMASELAISQDAKYLLVSNFENDSLTIIDALKNKILDELDLRPSAHHFKDVSVGGEFPFGVAITKENKIYVSSMRDNNIALLSIKNKHLKLEKYLKAGSSPARLLYNKENNELFVCNSRSDEVMIFDTKSDKVKASFSTLAPSESYDNRLNLKGANPNSMVLSEDKKTLLVSNGGTNSVAVFKLKREDNKAIEVVFKGLIPTLWYPNDLALVDEKIYVINGKSLSGANEKSCMKSNLLSDKENKKCKGSNEYVWQTKNSSLQTIKFPTTSELSKMTQQVLQNNHMLSKATQKNDKKLMKFLQKRIKHIIYVIKENRTYDQVLGDLSKANGDANLTLFPKEISPNHHKLADNFVTLDNLMASGSCSGDGWVWSTAAHTTDYVEKLMPILYARRGLSYDVEGKNREIPVSYDDIKDRKLNSPGVPDDENILPGVNDISAPDGPFEEAGTGYLWNEALRKNLSVRNYGFFCNNSRYFVKKDNPTFLQPYEDSYKRKYRQSYPNKKELWALSDPYFRGFDMTYPDVWRYKEWQREYDVFIKEKNMPNLMLMRLPRDHFGSFKNSLIGIDTPLKQMGDNDYALGLLVEKVAHSPYKNSTLIFVIEDDAQNGADHVSAQRTIGYVVGPYVKQNQVVSTHYTTVNMLKTIESILGMDPLGVNDGFSRPMSEVFDVSQVDWDYNAIIPNILYDTDLKLPKRDIVKKTIQKRSSEYWEKAMKSENFQSEDKLNTTKFNKELWKGIKGKEFPNI